MRGRDRVSVLVVEPAYLLVEGVRPEREPNKRKLPNGDLAGPPWLISEHSA